MPEQTGPERLIEALRAEFEGEVVFHENFPPNIIPPAVIVMPGDPFLVPGTNGMVEERLDILVAFNISAKHRNTDQMRRNCLKIRKATGLVGGVWQRASGPVFPSEDTNTTTRLIVNTVTFKHPPELILEQGDETP